MDIIFPDETLLNLIEPQFSYYDKKSFEKKTGITKPKYKLLRKKLPFPLNSFIFFVLTTNANACERFFTLCLYQNDWSNTRTGYLTEKCSYLDIRKIEVLDEKNILKKMKDGDNKFLKIARLCDKKFAEIKILYKNSYQNPVNVSKDVIELIEIATTDSEEKILQRLGL